jgi:hypothetical protein
MQQGIGNIQAVTFIPENLGAFSFGFSDGFEIY